MAVALSQAMDDQYTIKPQSSAPAIDTSDWPLLLRNYERRELAHFTSFTSPQQHNLNK